MKTLGRPEYFCIIIFKNFNQQLFKKSRCNASGDRFCNTFTNQSLIVVKCHVALKTFVTVELTYVAPNDSFININDP